MGVERMRRLPEAIQRNHQNNRPMRIPTGFPFMSRILLLLLAACLFDSGVVRAVESAHYLEARQKYEKKEYLLAMLAAEKAVREDGENADYRYLYGAILLELKQYSEAEVNLRRAVGAVPDRAEFQYSLGELLLVRTMEAAILKETRSGVGQPRMRNVDPEGVKALERAVELDPDLLKARLRLGRAYYDLNRHDLALDQFEAVAQKDPSYPWVHSSMAVVHVNAGSVEAAVQVLKRELQYHPDHHSAGSSWEKPCSRPATHSRRYGTCSRSKRKTCLPLTVWPSTTLSRRPTGTWAGWRRQWQPHGARLS